jgi:hypothetical protein
LSKQHQPEILYEVKDRGSKFYKKYQWCVAWNQPEVNTLRNSLDEYKTEQAIANARYWEHQRWNRSYGRTTEFQSQITTSVVNDIHRVRTLLAQNSDHKRMLSVGYISVYTDDDSFKDQLLALAKTISHRMVVRQAQVIYPEDSIVLQEPKYRFRTYLRSRKITSENIDTLKNWVQAQGNELRPGPGLEYFMKTQKGGYFKIPNWTMDYHFFDHNDLRYETMLRMVLPVAIRKTVPIVAK